MCVCYKHSHIISHMTINNLTIDDSETPPIQDARDVCANWTQATQALHGTCSTFAHTTVQCFGGMSNIDFSLPPMVDTEELILCGWPDTNFDAPLVLRHFPNIQMLRIQHSANLTYIDKDFPEMRHLETINISQTQLGYTRPTLFSELRALRTVDLRWNRLDRMEGPLLLARAPQFERLYLADGNPWNCARNFWWLLNETRRAHGVVDRAQMRCADWKYKGRPVMTIMHYKMVREAKWRSGNSRGGCFNMLSIYVRPETSGGMRQSHGVEELLVHHFLCAVDGRWRLVAAAVRDQLQPFEFESVAGFCAREHDDFPCD